MEIVSGKASGIGDDVRFAEVYTRCRDPIVDYCRRRVSSDAVDDAVADTFLVVWRRIDEVPAGGAGLLWIYAVAYRVVGHHWRSTTRRRRLQGRLDSLGSGSVVDAGETAVDDEECRLLLGALDSLADTDAEILRLAIWEELSVAEIATVLGIIPNAVRQRLYRARRRLAHEYERLRRGSVSNADSMGGMR
jgi:RNA polymerase sigma-70 factor (ECF subfamily)